MRHARGLIVAVVLLLLVGGLVAGAWSYFFDPGGPLIEPPKRPDAPLAVEDRPGGVIEVTSSDPTGKRWPFARWTEDIADLRRMDTPVGFKLGADIEADKVALLNDERFDIKMKDAQFQEVVDFLAGRVVKHDIRVYTREPEFIEDVTYNFDMRDARVIDVIRDMKGQSRGRLKWHISQLGVCMGSWEACENDKRENALTEARRRADFDAETPLLQVDYRADFDRAHIGDIVRDIEEKTGVEVIVDYDAWEHPNRLRLRTEPRPLSLVLDELCVALGTVVRVKDGRAFLLSP